MGILDKLHSNTHMSTIQNEIDRTAENNRRLRDHARITKQQIKPTQKTPDPWEFTYPSRLKAHELLIKLGWNQAGDMYDKDTVSVTLKYSKGRWIVVRLNSVEEVK